jgi:peroxiredoxin
MTIVTIADQVNAMKGNRPARREGEPPSPFEQEQAVLASMGDPKGVIELGAKLYDADLLDPFGAATSLYGALGEGQAVVVFYRGVWCPFCNIALKTYQAELLPELHDRGVVLVAISPQKPDGSLSITEKDNLSYAVLSDSRNQVAGQVGILTAPSPEALAAQLSHGLDLREVNADGTKTLPMPTTLIVDRDRTVRWVDVHPDYTRRSEPEEILAALDSLR